MTELAKRIAALHARIERAAQRASRDPGGVKLVAVSKTFGADRVLEAADAGLSVFGENRVQEAAEKLPEVAKRVRGKLEWHLVGRLQRNKARRAVELFDVIESVDRPELARALARAAEALGRRPRVLVQVNLDDEPQKGGVGPSEAPALVEMVAALPGLELVGLMAVPRARRDAEAQAPAFARLRSLQGELTLQHPELTELSMGMSADFEVAVREGATWVRIGSAIFGERKPR